MVDLPDVLCVVAGAKVCCVCCRCHGEEPTGNAVCCCSCQGVLCIVAGVTVVDLPEMLCVVVGAKVCCVLMQVPM